MGILDEAIREHLELKRQHGAEEPELKQLEDEAFGPPARPGEPAPEEPATELLSEPSSELEPSPDPELEAVAAPPALEAPFEPKPEVSAEPQPEEPSAGPSTEESERQAIAEQPTEIFDVEEEYASSQPQSPSEEELVEEELAEPRLAPADPLDGLEHVEAEAPETGEQAAESEIEAEDEDLEDDDFFNEQRLSEELDQALDAPRDSGPSDFEDDGEEEAREPTEPTESEEIEVVAENEEVREEPISEEARRGEHEDVLEETPDFLEETEDDELWFEQKPPKDFDFDD
jgi:hypothetical protein